jgi:ferredoxin
MIVRIEGRDDFREAAEGESLLDILKRWGVSLDAPCGGHQRCGKCLVRVLGGTFTGKRSLDAPPDSENGWVRACAVYPASDLLLAPPGRETFSASASPGLGGKRSLRAGLALDIGTTTLCVRLLDLDTGEGEIGRAHV